MKTLTKTIATALGITASCAMMLPTSPAGAHEMKDHGGHRMHGKSCATSEDHQAWAKQQIESEAAHLRLKEYQLSAWGVYAAAKVDLYLTYDDKNTTSEANIDAGAVMRLHANYAFNKASKLSKLADATESLQKLLTDEQRKIFNQLVTRSSAHRHGHLHRPETATSATKPVSGNAAQK